MGRGTTDSAELYDPVTGKFTAIAKLTARRGEPRATMLANGDVLITGGDDHDGPSGHLLRLKSSTRPAWRFTQPGRCIMPAWRTQRHCSTTGRF